MTETQKAIKLLAEANGMTVVEDEEAVAESIEWRYIRCRDGQYLIISGDEHQGSRICRVYRETDAKHIAMLPELLEAVGDLFQWFDSNGGLLHAPFISDEERGKALRKLGSIYKQAKGAG